MLIYKVKMTNSSWFQLFKYEDFLLFPIFI